MESSSFLNLFSIEEEEKYHNCNKTFGTKDKIRTLFRVNRGPNFKEQAEK